MKLSELVKQYRTEHKMSLREFGDACELSHVAIKNIETGISPKTGTGIAVSLPTLNKLANGMGMTLEELVTLADDMPIDINKAPIHTDERMSFTRRKFLNTIVDLSDSEIEKLQAIVDMIISNRQS